MTTRIFCVLEEEVLAVLILVLVLVLALEEQKDASEFVDAVDAIDASDKRGMLLSLFDVLLRSDSMIRFLISPYLVLNISTVLFGL